MRKIAFISILAGLFLTSCVEGDYGIKPADPQTNPQEEPVTFPSALSVSAVSAIDLAAVGSDSVAVAAYTPVETSVGEFGNFRIVVDDTYVFAVGTDMKVPVNELQNMVVETYGKRPSPRTFKGVLEADVLVGGQGSYVASPSFDITLTPQAPFIASAYYLIGNLNDWNTDNALNYRFNHSGKDVYEDPVFTITFSAGADCYWKIIPQSNYDVNDPWRAGVADGVVGVVVDGDSAAEGVLVTENPQAGKIPAAGTYMMTINMMDYTYSIKALAAEYYLVGDNFAWDVNTKKNIMYAESAAVQSYTGYFNGNLKFINGNDMGNDNWGACYGTAADGDTSANGTLQQNAGAIHSPAAGYYTFEVNLDAMTYSWTRLENQTPEEYTTIGLVGAFNGWNQAEDANQMTQLTPHNWFKTMTLAEGELKFNANKDWAISWGGETDLNIGDDNYGVTTTANGKNMFVPAGTYDIFFNDITGRFVFVRK